MIGKLEIYRDSLIEIIPCSKRRHWLAGVHINGRIFYHTREKRFTEPEAVETGKRLIDFIETNPDNFEARFYGATPINYYFEDDKQGFIELNFLESNWHLGGVHLFGKTYFTGKSSFRSLKRATKFGRQLIDFIVNNPDKFEDWGCHYKNTGELGITIYRKPYISYQEKDGCTVKEILPYGILPSRFEDIGFHPAPCTPPYSYDLETKCLTVIRDDNLFGWFTAESLSQSV